MVFKVTSHPKHSWHRNGIKKPKTHRYESLKGVTVMFLTHMESALGCL
uniref:60S ribosomal protein L29 n=1 Tax=Malurus cyaneus samueli TaxID=2593467 RepID=A0A8C5T7E3_9PASS